MSAFLEKVINSTSQSLRGCIKRGVLCVLYMQEAGGRGVEGANCADIRTDNSSSKLNSNLSVRLSKRSLRTEPASVRNLFQNGYPCTLIEMLKHSVRLPEHCFQFKNIELHCN